MDSWQIHMLWNTLFLWKGPKKERVSLFSIVDMHLVVQVESLVGLDTQLSETSAPNAVSGFDCSVLLARRTGKGWTPRSLWSLLASQFSIWLKANPTASEFAVAIQLELVSLQKQLKPLWWMTNSVSVWSYVLNYLHGIFSVYDVIVLSEDR